MLRVYTKKEYLEYAGMEEEDISLDETKSVEFVVANDDEDVPYVGIIYTNGKCAVIGCGFDRYVDVVLMMDMVNN